MKKNDPETPIIDDGRLIDPDVDTTAGLEGASHADDVLEKEKLRTAVQSVISKAKNPNSKKRDREATLPDGDIVKWPTQGKELVSESEYGIFAKAFPKLLSRGSGDVTSAANWKSANLAAWGNT